MRALFRIFALITAALSLATLVGSVLAQHVAPWPLDGKIEGQVFIVTRGGFSLKLGLVTVHATSDAASRAFLQDRSAEIAARHQDLEGQLRGSEARVASAEQRLAEAKRKDEREWRAYMALPELDRPGSTIDPVANQKAIDLAKAEVKRQWTARARITDSIRDLNLAKAACSTLPEGFAAVKTDADGHFSVTVPRGEPFVLAATTSRLVMDATEEYCWLIRVSLDGAASKTVLLSNDNLVGAGAAESLLH